MAEAANINGYPILWYAPIRWRLRIGVDPYIGEFPMRRDHAHAIMQYTQPVMLTIDDIQVKNLFPIGTGMTDHPDQMYIMLADMRWLWKYVHIGPKRYNWVRKSGNRRWFGDTDNFEDIQKVQDEYLYTEWSLKNKLDEIWTATDVLKDVMDELKSKTKDVIAWSYSDLPSGALNRQTPIESFLVDHPGHLALDKALKQIPGASYYVNFEGNLQSVDLLDGSDIKNIPKGWEPGLLQPVVWDTPIAMVPDRTLLRPKQIDVLFTCEYELRFDYHDPPETITKDSRTLDNVLQVVDPNITYGGVKLAYGTWLELRQWVESLTESGKRSPVFTPAGAPAQTGEFLTEALIQKLYTTGLLMMEFAAGFGAAVPDPLWQRRIGEVYNQYGKTFRIPRHWLDRIFTWEQRMLKIINPYTGERAASQVCSNFAFRYPINRTARDPIEDGKTVLNITGYNEQAISATPASARLAMVDMDQGIFTIQYLVNQWGGVAEIYPRQVVDSTIPRLEVNGTNTITQGDIQLEATHDLFVIISAIPAAPANTNQLYRITVTPDEASRMLKREIGTCRGPVKEIRIHPTPALTARFGWTDDKAALIERAFGVNNGEGPGHDLDANLINWAILKLVARSVAAQEYARVIDKAEGTLTLGGLQPEILPQGNMGSVDYVISQFGSRTTNPGFRTLEPSVIQESILADAVQKQLGWILRTPDK